MEGTWGLVKLINGFYFSSVFSADWIMLPCLSALNHPDRTVCAPFVFSCLTFVSLICHLKHWQGPFYSITGITTHWPCTQPNNNSKKHKLYFLLGEGIVGVLFSKEFLESFLDIHKNMAYKTYAYVFLLQDSAGLILIVEATEHKGQGFWFKLMFKC